jgi:hypothetical protein
MYLIRAEWRIMITVCDTVNKIRLKKWQHRIRKKKKFFFLYGIILILKFRAIFLQISHASTDNDKKVLLSKKKKKKLNHMILNKLKKDPQKSNVLFPTQ